MNAHNFLLTFSFIYGFVRVSKENPLKILKNLQKNQKAKVYN